MGSLRLRPVVCNMKIAYLITRFDSIGGAQVHVRDLSLAMAAQGCEIHILTGLGGPALDALAERGVNCRRLPSLVRPVRPAKDFRALGEVGAALREIEPDLLSTHSSKAGWLGRLAGRLAGVPVIFTAHGWAFADGVPAAKAGFYRLAERLAGRLSQRIITVSEADFRLAAASRIAPAKRMVAIHNGVPDISAKLAADPGRQPPRVIMVARFDRQKDHATLLQALNHLKEKAWSLDLVGDGPLRPQVVELAVRLGLQERVRFVGSRPDVAEYLARAQVFVLSSKWEGLPRSILEAMRAGLPTVASDVGGVRETVAEGQTGSLCVPGDVRSLRDGLLSLLDRPDLRIELGRAARRRYEERFTFDRMLEQTQSVYREILAGRKLPGGRR